MTRSDAQAWDSVLRRVRASLSDARADQAGPELAAILPGLEAEFLSPQVLDVRCPGELSGGARQQLLSALSGAAALARGRPVEVRLRTAPAAQLDLPFIRRAATEPYEQLRLNPNYPFENFVVAPNNRLAHAACVAVSDAPGAAYNPLFVHGTVGLGKSHLLQAACHRLLERQKDSDVLYLSSESFVNQYIAAVERGEVAEFRHRFRHLGVLVIDDIHFLADKERSQEEFFHTFNALYQAQRQVILSSDSPPQDIPRLEERLASRFKWGLVARIEKPCFETRVAIVVKKARPRGLEMPDEVARYIARVIDTNVRELEGAVVRVAAQVTLSGQPVTLELAREVLADSLPKQPRLLTVPEIIGAVTRKFGVRVSDLQGKRRNKSVALPRQVCMHLARRLTKLSLEEIGGYFGGRDHTTVLHAERKVEEALRGDAELKAILDALVGELAGGSP